MYLMFWRTPLVKRGELCFCRNYLHNFPWSVFSFLHSPLVKQCRLRWSFSVVCSSHQPGPCLHKYLNSWCQHQHPPHHTPTTFRNVKLNPGYLSYRLGPGMKYMKYILWKYLYVVSGVVSSCIIKVSTTGFLSAEVSEDKVVFVIIRMQISRITFLD